MLSRKENGGEEPVLTFSSPEVAGEGQTHAGQLSEHHPTKEAASSDTEWQPEDSTTSQTKCPEIQDAVVAKSGSQRPVATYRENQATPSLMIQLPREQVEALEAAAVLVVQACTQLAPSRQTTLRHRNELHYEQETSKYNRQYFRQSADDFVKHAYLSRVNPVPQGTVPDGVPTSDEVAKFHGLFVQDHEAVDSQDEKIGRLQEVVSRKEFSMQSREKKLNDAAFQILNIIKDLGLARLKHGDLTGELGTMSQEHSISSQVPSIAIPVILESYYQEVRNLGVIRQRLIDLKIEHRESETLRLLRQDQELPVEPSDEEFFERHHERWAELTHAYDAAALAVANARATCVEEGIDPEDYLEAPSTNLDSPNILDAGLYPPPVLLTEDPVTPEEVMTTNEDSFLDERNLSTAKLTAITGNLDEEVQRFSLQYNTTDIYRVKKRVEDWMQKSDVEGIHFSGEGDGVSPPERSVGSQAEDNTTQVPKLRVEEAASTPQDSIITPGGQQENSSSDEPKADSRRRSPNLDFGEEPPHEQRKDSPLVHPIPP